VYDVRLKKKVFCVFFIVFLFFCLCPFVALGKLLYEKWVDSKSDDVIRTLIQVGPEKGALPTMYLAELMELSIDCPKKFHHFDVLQAQKNLLCSPVIKLSRVEKRKPDTIYVDYEVFYPFMQIGDADNLLIDREGNIFPMKPFFSPKQLPKIFLEVFEWRRFDVARKIYDFLQQQKLSCTFEQRLLSIDVSRMVHAGCVMEEVILSLKNNTEGGAIHYLRMTPSCFMQEWNYYVLMKQNFLHSLPGDVLIDLRTSKLAYIENFGEKYCSQRN